MVAHAWLKRDDDDCRLDKLDKSVFRLGILGLVGARPVPLGRDK